MNREAFIAHLNLHGWIAARVEPPRMFVAAAERIYFVAVGHPLLETVAGTHVRHATGNGFPVTEDIYLDWCAEQFHLRWEVVSDAALSGFATYLGVEYEPRADD